MNKEVRKHEDFIVEIDRDNGEIYFSTVIFRYDDNDVIIGFEKCQGYLEHDILDGVLFNYTSTNPVSVDIYKNHEERLSILPVISKFDMAEILPKVVTSTSGKSPLDY